MKFIKCKVSHTFEKSTKKPVKCEQNIHTVRSFPDHYFSPSTPLGPDILVPQNEMVK